jgi:uroporphyrinogen decarboxylase
MNAVKTIRHELNGRVPLIGFSGSPWTLATYMIEGGGSKEYRYAKGLMYSDPGALHALLEKLAIAVTDYLNAQIAAGAQAVQIFDTWGGVLSEPAYREFSLVYMERIVKGLVRESEGRQVPVILFTKGGGAWLEQMAATGCDALGLDWTVDLGRCRERVGSQVALQGNLDPSVLFGSDELITSEVERLLKSFGSNPGHVFNLGHGINQHVDPQRPATMIDAVQRISREIHSGSH